MNIGEAQMSQNSFQKQKSQNKPWLVKKKGKGKNMCFFLMFGDTRKGIYVAVAYRRYCNMTDNKRRSF